MRVKDDNIQRVGGVKWVPNKFESFCFWSVRCDITQVYLDLLDTWLDVSADNVGKLRLVAHSQSQYLSSMLKQNP